MFFVMVVTDAGSYVAFQQLKRCNAEIYAAMLLDGIEAKESKVINDIQQCLQLNGFGKATTVYGVQLLSVKRDRYKMELWRAGGDSTPSSNADDNPAGRRIHDGNGDNGTRSRGSELHELRKNGGLFTGDGVGEGEPGGSRNKRPEARKPRRKRG